MTIKNPRKSKQADYHGDSTFLIIVFRKQSTFTKFPIIVFLFFEIFFDISRHILFMFAIRTTPKTFKFFD